MYVWLDERAKQRLTPVLSEAIRVNWVKPTVIARLRAEQEIAALGTKKDILVAFNGLPPLLARDPKIVLFLQNRLYLENFKTLFNYRIKTALRLFVEMRLFEALSNRVSKYVVQTPTMYQALSLWIMRRVRQQQQPISICPFFELGEQAQPKTKDIIQWDFLYVADGEAHKNHMRLLDAWINLARSGLKPRLALTLGRKDQALISAIEQLSAQHDLNVVNLGELSRSDLLSTYRHSGALIFPSLSESFGLPLIEASQLGLPILAGELDYVRDVCAPTETFDPMSPRSIERAVRRFRAVGDDPIQIQSGVDFWGAVLG
jgi:glycosyltransferase involved in cell wall biosynthesis